MLLGSDTITEPTVLFREKENVYFFNCSYLVVETVLFAYFENMQNTAYKIFIIRTKCGSMPAY